MYFQIALVYNACRSRFQTWPSFDQLIVRSYTCLLYTSDKELINNNDDVENNFFFFCGVESGRWKPVLFVTVLLASSDNCNWLLNFILKLVVPSLIAVVEIICVHSRVIIVRIMLIVVIMHQDRKVNSRIQHCIPVSYTHLIK